MTRIGELNQMADDYVRLRQGQLASKRDEARKLREQLSKIEAELARVQDLSRQRERYQPIVGGVPTCPYCSLEVGLPVQLIPLSSQTSMDEWKCRECDRRFTLSAP